MDTRLVPILLLLSLITLNYSSEIEEVDRGGRLPYDPIGILTKTAQDLQKSIHLRDSGLLDNLEFNGLNQSFEFPPLPLLNSYKCLADVRYTFQNIKNKWALQLFDSYGKPESGILQGNVRWIGNYDECLAVRAENPNSTIIGNYRGKYCSLTWSLSALNLSIPLSFVSGVCIPDTCSELDLKEDILMLLRYAGINPTVKDEAAILSSKALQCKPRERHLNGAAKGVIALLSIFCALTVLGSSVTAVKYFMKVVSDSKGSYLTMNVSEGSQVIGDENSTLQKHADHDDKELLQDGQVAGKPNGPLQKIETVLQCFCVFTNGAKLLNTQSSEGELLCIHGIRFLSMSWVILGHSYVFGISEINNFTELESLTNNFAFQVMLQAFFSVDSFFVLSGFLLAYLSMKQFSKSESSINWPYFYIHRYLRLTPMYMVLLGFSATVNNYLGSGPYWTDNDIDPNCKDKWWWNLLYINNFDSTAQCMGWSWYLANDMQFFVISPIFLISLWKWPIVGYVILAVFLAANCLANFFITYHFDLPAGVVTIINENLLTDMTTALAKFNDYFLKLYIKPYTRIGPYLIAVLAGYLLFKRRTLRNPKHSLGFLSAGWVLATTLTLAVVYGLYQRNMSLVETGFYNAFSRTCFAIGLCWVIYVCLVGQGGPVNTILSFKFFIPLSRLTYAAYLIHPMIITGYFASLKTSIAFSHPTIVVLYLGFMVVTYCLALPVALILESPIVSLEKLIRKAFVKEKKETVVN